MQLMTLRSTDLRVKVVRGPCGNAYTDQFTCSVGQVEVFTKQCNKAEGILLEHWQESKHHLLLLSFPLFLPI